MIAYVARKINSLPGVSEVGISDDGVIVATVEGVNRPLREEIVDICKRAMLPAKVFYKQEDGTLTTEAAIAENSGFALPLLSYSGGMIAQLGVGGPVEPDKRFYSTVAVQGAPGDAPEAPADEVAASVDGAKKLKRLRAKTRGRPVVGWKIGDDVVRPGASLKALDHCSMQWTLGRILNIKPGAVAHVTELSTRRPIVYADVGEYSGVEIPVHMLGKMFDLVTDHDKTIGRTIDQVRKESAKAEGTGADEVLRHSSVCENDCEKVECGCDGDGEEEADALLKPKKAFRKKVNTKK